MLSGVIFVALALLWALFLIPKALRSHDEAARPRSVESTSDHARVLTRRDSTAPVAEATPPPPPATVPEQRRPVDRIAVERQRRLAAAAARRRRRVLGLLLLATAVVGVLAVTQVLLPWAPAVPAVVVLGFLVVARVTVRAERRRWDATRVRLAADSAGPVVGADEDVEPVEPVRVAETPAAGQPGASDTGQAVVVPIVRNDQGVAVVGDAEDTSAYSADVLAEAVGASTVPPPSTLWDPLPVTLPTYVGKARATRSVRTIDLAAPGVASSGRDAADSALVAEAATAVGADQDVPGRRAVGG